MTYFTYPGVNTSNAASSQPSQAGLNMVSEYMASGLPFTYFSTLTTAVTEIALPYVSSRLYFNTTLGTIRIGFTANGVNGTNYFQLKAGDGCLAVDIRCTKLYVRSDTGSTNISFMAAMTQIDNMRSPIYTGSVADPVTGKNMFLTGSSVYQIGWGGGLG